MLTELLILATEGGIPASNPWAKFGMPLGSIIFIGSVYLLLRSNLGTKRGYLVMATSFLGFTFLLALFWTFGAPGTPPATGPQNLPGQELNEYEPIWVPFAPDSEVANQPTYAVVQNFPDGFGDVPADFAEEAESGANEVITFFAGLSDPYQPILGGLEEPEILGYAEAENGRPIIAVNAQPTCQLNSSGELPPECQGLQPGDVVPGAEQQLFFAFFDAGAPLFPSLLTTLIVGVLFALHMVLLWRDEKAERALREAATAQEETTTEEPEPAGV